MKKVLLDENLPRKLKNYFSDAFEVITVPDLHWQSKKNGELLTAMDESEIEYLLTSDKSLRHQQNLEKYDVKIVVILTFDNRLKNLISKISTIESAILTTDNSAKVIEIDIRDK